MAERDYGSANDQGTHARLNVPRADLLEKRARRRRYARIRLIRGEPDFLVIFWMCMKWVLECITGNIYNALLSAIRGELSRTNCCVGSSELS